MKKANDTLVVGLDVGSQTIKCCCGLIDKEGQRKVVDILKSPSRGIKEGIICDAPSVISAIESTLRMVEDKLNLPIYSVYTGLNGQYVMRSDHSAYTEIKNNDGHITRNDLKKLKMAVKNVGIPYERQLIHIIPIDYEIDGMRGIKNPLGMYGSHVGLHVNVITAYRNYVQNFVQAVKGCGIEVEELRLALSALADVVLSEEEKQQGIILTKVGAQLVEVALFKHGYLADFAVFAMGGDTITQAIADGFNISYTGAENLKVRYGSCSSKIKVSDENLIVKTEIGQTYFSREKLCQIIDQQVRILLTQVHNQIVTRRMYREAAAGVRFVGGGCLLDGFLEVSEEIMGLECRMGAITQKIKNQIILPAMDMTCATALGLVNYGFDWYALKRNPPIKNYWHKVAHTVQEFCLEYF